ncbi:hypothetical protein F4678DRAFT_203333 [Xylaria arbuscula]|nr:hypothetical protein F4678DRAFT_203333 [Xylaria arbuscula]
MRLFQFGLVLAIQTILAAADDLPLPPLPPWYPLLPWQISTVSTYNPHESPYGTNASGLLLTISNVQQLPAVPAPIASGGGYVAFQTSTAQCELHWKADDLTPYGYSTNSCTTNPVANDYSNSKWQMTLRELHTDLDGPGDYYFSLEFQLSVNGTIYATNGYKIITGSASFDASTNLEGECGDDGLCKYQLRNDSSPVLLQPTLQECKSTCG